MLPTVEDCIIESFELETLAKNPSWTWSHGYREPLLSAGFLPIVPGVVETWAIVNPVLSRMRCRVELIYDLYDFHLDYCSRHDIRRVQCMVDGSFPQGQTFVEHLGYRYESVLKEWGRDGGSRIRYAWFLKDHIQ